MKTKVFNKQSFCRPVNNQRGVVLIVALMVLVILTLLGALSLQIANNEVTTAGNQEEYLTTFYMLEGVGVEGIARLEYQNATGSDCGDPTPANCRVKQLYEAETTALTWLDEVYSNDTTKNTFDLSVTDTTATSDDSELPRILNYPNNWLLGKTDRVANPLQIGNDPALEPLGYNEAANDLIRFAVQDFGRTGIYSIGSGDPEVHGYRIFGLYDVKRGQGKAYTGRSVVSMGYRMELEKMDIL